MKKLHAYLSLALTAMMLVSCGNSISEAQAIAAGKKIAEKHQEDSFAYPDRSSVEYSASEVSKSGSEEVTMSIAYVKDTYVRSDTTTKTSAVSNGTTVNSTSIDSQWLYSKTEDGANKYYSVIHTKDEKSETKSYSIVSQAAFAILMGTASVVKTSIVALGEIGYGSLASIIGELEAKNSSSSSVSESSSEDDSSEEAEVVINASSKLSYASSGDGNLSINVELSVSVEGGSEAYKGSIAFDNYYPSSFSSEAVYSGTDSSTGSNVSYTDKGSANFKWGNCDISYPDLTGYTQIAA